MHIDSYRFGRIVIDGAEYTSDLIIVGGQVQAGWRRKDGHVLNPEDLQTIIKAKPEVLVIGCGAYGIMKIAEVTRRILDQKGIRLEAFNTDQAVQRFNELTGVQENVSAGLHLTC